MQPIKSKIAYLVLGLFFLFAITPNGTAQQSQHSAKKAAILSACIPGAGQIYNGKWWKTPIVYAGLAGIGYMAYDNYSNYQLFLLAYRTKTGNLEEGEIPSEIAIQLSESYQETQLQTYKESYRHDFELYCIILAAWYGLNIIDATVDGHLYTYDISDDLSLSIDPVFTISEAPCLAYSGRRQTGLTLTFNF